MWEVRIGRVIPIDTAADTGGGSRPVTRKREHARFVVYVHTRVRSLSTMKMIRIIHRRLSAL